MRFDKEKFMRQMRVNLRLAKRNVKEGLDKVVDASKDFFGNAAEFFEEHFEEVKEELKNKEHKCCGGNCHSHKEEHECKCSNCHEKDDEE